MVDFRRIWVYTYIIEMKEVSNMTITVKTKKDFENKIKEYRNKGFNLITLSNKIAELENENEIIIIER